LLWHWHRASLRAIFRLAGLRKDKALATLPLRGHFDQDAEQAIEFLRLAHREVIAAMLNGRAADGPRPE
jgi:hypothetical protein